MQLAVHSLDLTAPQEGGAGPPLVGALCPDWIKSAGIPEHFFILFFLPELREERHDLLNKLFTTAITVGTRPVSEEVGLPDVVYWKKWTQCFLHKKRNNLLTEHKMTKGSND